MANKLLNFRCPPELLEAIDALGVQRYPADNDNGYDRTKTLIDVITAGIQALNDGSVDIPISKTDSKTSRKTDFNPTNLKDEILNVLVPQLNEALEDYDRKFEAVETRLKELRA